MKIQNKFPKYKEYKPSGNEWLGEIPVNWKISKIKFIGKYINGVAFKPEEWSVSGKKIIRIQNLSGESNIYNYFEGKKPKKYIIKKGDYLISWSASLGFYEWDEEDNAWLNQHIFKVIPNNVLTINQFYKWLAFWFMEELKKEIHGSTMKHLTDNAFGSFIVYLPSFKEQQFIAAFLDHETAKIDDLVSKYQRLILLLQEKRIALITHIVTRGLDPDVPLKDSGVRWLGKMPSHWQLHKLKHLSHLQFSSVDKISIEGELPVQLCNYTDVYKNEFITNCIDFMNATGSRFEVEKSYITKGDVLVTKDSESWTDIVIPAYVMQNFYKKVLCGYHLALIRPNKFDGRYLFRALQSKNINYQFQIESNGITRYGIGKSSLGNGLIYTPPLSEQHSIADFLDRETAKIDDQVSKIESLIIKMQEYRSALITAAVTGKIDVRGNS